MQKFVLLLFLLTVITKQASYTRNTCTTAQILNPLTLTCLSCPNNMRPNPAQTIPTSCICNKGYFPTSATTCQYLGTNTSIVCNNSKFFDVINDAGQYTTPSSTNLCQTCDANAYANINGTGCIPCQRNMIYSSLEGTCICENNSLTYTQKGCFTTAEVASTSSIVISGSKYYNSLKYLFPSCAYFNDLLSCSQIVNLCILSMGYGDATNQPQCKFFTQLPAYQYYYQLDMNTNQFYISPGNFQKHDQMKLKILYYLPTGNFVKQKDMKLTDIFRCGLPSNNSAAINIGDNIEVSCTFNFNYLVEQSQANQYRNYLYQIFAMGQNKQYYPIPVYIGSSSVPVKRFFLEDTITSSTYVNVLTGLKLVFSLNSTGYLNTPQLVVSYKKLSIQNGAVTPTTDKNQAITYQIKFIYTLTTFWPAFFGIFITVNVLVLIQSIIRTYIAHLNRQSILNFFYYFGNFWSIWMFYFLLGISGYWFLFCKTTQNAYLFIPDSSSDIFYVAFFIIAGIMGLFRVLVVFVDKKDKINNQVFLVSKQPNQRSQNCWKQIFIVNSLAEFYTHRTISFFWMLLVLLFFLVGLNWQDHASEVSHINLSSIYYFNPINRVNLYFLGSSILLTIGIVFKILRRIVVIQWPYPFQDFVDYCYVTNISLLFMKKRSRQAYFIHASISGQTQVSFKQINEAIKKGIQKNRQILNQHNLHGNQGLYILYISQDWYDKFHNMIKRIQDEQNQQLVKSVKNSKNKKYVNPRQDFIKSKIREDLDKISSQHYSGHNQIYSRSLLRRFIGLPQQSFYNVKQARIIRDEYSDLVQQVFPNGNQFQQIHTIIILFLMFLLMTANVSAAAFLTYFVSQYIIDWWISNSCRSRLEKMTKVREGFML